MTHPLKFFLISLFFAAALGAGTHQVNVGPGMVFSPEVLTIEPGDTVTWMFREPSHTTTSDATTGPEVWNSGLVASGGNFSHTFAAIGDHPYHCAIHSFPGGTFMNGVITVAAALPEPTLTAVDPTSGPTAGGTLVTLSGSDFIPDCTATFGGSAEVATDLVDSGTLQATTPTHAAGSVDVTVDCSTGSSTLSGGFLFTDALAITGVSPPSGAPGREVILIGTGFDSAATVHFESISSAVVFVSPTELRVTVPDLPPGTVTITVTNPGGESSTFPGFVVLGEPAAIPALTTLGVALLAALLAAVAWKAILKV